MAPKHKLNDGVWEPACMFLKFIHREDKNKRSNLEAMLLLYFP